jgi:hypothetical protein
VTHKTARGSSSRRLSAVVRLLGPAGNQCVASLSQGLANQKFQFACFVAAECESRQIVAFHEYAGTAQHC